MQSKVHIKNMVCPRCIRIVSDTFGSLNIDIASIKLGEVNLLRPLSKDDIRSLQSELNFHGFELLEDKNAQLIEQIKTIIIELVHHSDEKLSVTFSSYLSEKLNRDYGALSRLFSSVEGVTIEKFMTTQKIERVKELIFYNELTLSEIAYALDYSSVAHLSSQFKKETGMTPSQFRKQRSAHHRPLDSLIPKS